MPVITDPGTMFFIVLKIGDLPELSGLAVKDPFTFHKIIDKKSPGFDFSILIVINKLIAIHFMNWLPVYIEFLFKHSVNNFSLLFLVPGLLVIQCPGRFQCYLILLYEGLEEETFALTGQITVLNTI